MNDAEAIKAVTLAAYYCTTEPGWTNFYNWMQERGLLKDGEQISRAQMIDACNTMQSIVREIEVQLLAARLTEILRNGEL